eukprot:m.163975 g.163975  ORF g.163975 m.163975 type:complete len:1667 (+) comp15223_c0_seq3:139-5139(+)
MVVGLEAYETQAAALSENLAGNFLESVNQLIQQYQSLQVPSTSEASSTALQELRGLYEKVVKSSSNCESVERDLESLQTKFTKFIMDLQQNSASQGIQETSLNAFPKPNNLAMLISDVFTEIWRSLEVPHNHSFTKEDFATKLLQHNAYRPTRLPLDTNSDLYKHFHNEIVKNLPESTIKTPEEAYISVSFMKKHYGDNVQAESLPFIPPKHGSKSLATGLLYFGQMKKVGNELKPTGLGACGGEEGRASGGFRYKGQWDDGQPHGYGRGVYKGKGLYEGLYNYGKQMMFTRANSDSSLSDLTEAPDNNATMVDDGDEELTTNADKGQYYSRLADEFLSIESKSVPVPVVARTSGDHGLRPCNKMNSLGQASSLEDMCLAALRCCSVALSPHTDTVPLPSASCKVSWASTPILNAFALTMSVVDYSVEIIVVSFAISGRGKRPRVSISVSEETKEWWQPALKYLTDKFCVPEYAKKQLLVVGLGHACTVAKAFFVDVQATNVIHKSKNILVLPQTIEYNKEEAMVCVDDDKPSSQELTLFKAADRVNNPSEVSKRLQACSQKTDKQLLSLLNSNISRLNENKPAEHVKAIPLLSIHVEAVKTFFRKSSGGKQFKLLLWGSNVDLATSCSLDTTTECVAMSRDDGTLGFLERQVTMWEVNNDKTVETVEEAFLVRQLIANESLDTVLNVRLENIFEQDPLFIPIAGEALVEDPQISDADTGETCLDQFGYQLIRFAYAAHDEKSAPPGVSAAAHKARVMKGVKELSSVLDTLGQHHTRLHNVLDWYHNEKTKCKEFIKEHKVKDKVRESLMEYLEMLPDHFEHIRKHDETPVGEKLSGFVHRFLYLSKTQKETINELFNDNEEIHRDSVYDDNELPFLYPGSVHMALSKGTTFRKDKDGIPVEVDTLLPNITAFAASVDRFSCLFYKHAEERLQFMARKKALDEGESFDIEADLEAISKHEECEKVFDEELNKEMESLRLALFLSRPALKTTFVCMQKRKVDFGKFSNWIASIAFELMGNIAFNSLPFDQTSQKLQQIELLYALRSNGTGESGVVLGSVYRCLALSKELHYRATWTHHRYPHTTHNSRSSKDTGKDSSNSSGSKESSTSKERTKSTNEEDREDQHNEVYAADVCGWPKQFSALALMFFPAPTKTTFTQAAQQMMQLKTEFDSLEPVDMLKTLQRLARKNIDDCDGDDDASRVARDNITMATNFVDCCKQTSTESQRQSMGLLVQLYVREAIRRPFGTRLVEIVIIGPCQHGKSTMMRNVFRRDVASGSTDRTKVPSVHFLSSHLLVVDTPGLEQTKDDHTSTSWRRSVEQASFVIVMEKLLNNSLGQNKEVIEFCQQRNTPCLVLNSLDPEKTVALLDKFRMLQQLMVHIPERQKDCWQLRGDGPPPLPASDVLEHCYSNLRSNGTAYCYYASMPNIDITNDKQALKDKKFGALLQRYKREWMLTPQRLLLVLERHLQVVSQLESSELDDVFSHLRDSDFYKEHYDDTDDLLLKVEPVTPVHIAPPTPVLQPMSSPRSTKTKALSFISTASALHQPIPRQSVADVLYNTTMYDTLEAVELCVANKKVLLKMVCKHETLYLEAMQGRASVEVADTTFGDLRGAELNHFILHTCPFVRVFGASAATCTCSQTTEEVKLYTANHQKLLDIIQTCCIHHDY